MSAVAAAPVEVRYVSARHRNDIGFSMVANDTLRLGQRDESRQGCDIWLEGKGVKKALGGGILAGQYKMMVMRAEQLVRMRERDGAIAELTLCDLARCLGQSELCRTRVFDSKQRRLRRYIAAAVAGGRLVKVGPKKYALRWHGTAPKIAQKQAKKTDIQFREVCRKDCSFCGQTRRLAPSAPARSKCTSRKRDGRGGHAAWAEQPRAASGRFGSRPIDCPDTPAGPQAASLAQTPSETPQADVPRLPEPLAVEQAEQQSAARGQVPWLAVVPPDPGLPDDDEVASADWVLEQAARSKYLAALALVPQLGKCRTRGAWRAGFGAVAAMAPGAVRCAAAVASHVARLVHEGRAPDPRRRPGYRAMAGWGLGLLTAANVQCG